MLCIMIAAPLLLIACRNDNATNEASPPVVHAQAPLEDTVVSTIGTVLTDEIEGRGLYIYLPAGYENSDKRYPVVYMHDGQNVLDASTSAFGKEWQVDEVLDNLGLQHQMKEVIVAAVAHGEMNRALEYVPFEDVMIPSDGKSAEAFTAFFIDTVIPYIDDNYRTIPDRDNRMIMGSSFGGIQALWMGYQHPEVFSAIGALSPSTWVANQRIIEEMKNKTGHPELRIWLDMGVSEGMEMDALVEALTAQGLENGENIFYLMDKDGQHDELSWSKRVHNPLLMFGGDAPGQAISMEVNDYRTSFLLDNQIRINPVVTMDNGMSFTVSSAATYKVLDPEKGRVDSKGNVTFLQKEPIDVEISYKGLTELYTIDYDQYSQIITE